DGQSSDQYADGRKLRTHLVYLLARGFLVAGMPVTFAFISVLASGRDFGHIRRLQYSEPLQAGTTNVTEAV
ncbi:MAG: hypothetical protein WCC93_04020, partial [Chthoniobacterales bacterium]